ncbi:MAG: ATP-binding cassette domain-containing protein [Rheinheimera sp.]|nr:ATP-binding cassette domain-containing protein [Rheinheimera sp.]
MATPAAAHSIMCSMAIANCAVLELEIATALQDPEHNGEQLAHLYGDMENIHAYTAPSRAQQLLNGLGFAPGDDKRPVSDFSGGWRIRLNLAQALMCPSDLLLLDEPTNHLDLDATLWLEEWLKRYPGTLIIISHDRDFLDNIVDRIVNIEKQKLDLYSGNYSSFERQRAEKLAQQQATFEKQQERIAHVENYIRRFRAQATKARQAQSRIKELERMEKIAPAHIDSPFTFTFKCNDKMSVPLSNT